MRRVADGEEVALRMLYERHAAGMLRLIRRLTSQREVAEEILQESWLAVWRSAGSFRGEAPVRAWLLGVARRQAHNRLRRAEPVLVDLEKAADVPDLEPAVDEQVLARAERRDLVAAVAELPEHLREVLVLVLAEDLPYPQVAVILGIPTGTVKSRMHMARRLLTEALTKTTNPKGGRTGDR
ncbi:RNA polymerase sigma factor [Microbispora sp. ATCC PTA-5024]|uniref:RNA polymerase sigma factor n=1 Tax=Microbispora sp. ATCC PTA-5024 TaxID=316330 RepID=UPI000569A511|nr:RNA polymerase sigma factor [Microbispora sp. ATCC PTA-5024]